MARVISLALLPFNVDTNAGHDSIPLALFDLRDSLYSSVSISSTQHAP